MKKWLLFCACMLLPIPVQHTNPKIQDNRCLVTAISTTYKISKREANAALYYADKHSTKTVSKLDILAIMAIESNFKHNAVSRRKAKGIMQVLYKKTSTMDDNVVAGVWLLSEYIRLLKSKKAAIMAYNVGIGNYRKGVRNQAYYNKFIREVNKLQQIEKDINV